MPRKEFDYSKTEIYKIIHIDPDVDLCYIGHTTNFTKRKYSHKKSCNNEKSRQHNLKVYQTIRDNGGWDSFKMIFVEKFACNNEREASAREQYWIDILKPNMNTINAVIDCDKAEYNRLYAEKNKEQLNAKRRERYRLKKEQLDQAL